MARRVWSSASSSPAHRSSQSQVPKNAPSASRTVSDVMIDQFGVVTPGRMAISSRTTGAPVATTLEA